MEVKQIYSLMNDVTTELLGKSDLVKEDLSNIVDVGTEIFNASSIDSYVKSLVNRIGKTVFVNRVYSGSAPSMLFDSWEFGSVLQKINAELPTATENDTWNLTNGQSYDTNVFYKPNISAKFFNKSVTFEVAMSFTERQVKQSFISVSELNAFLSMIENAVQNSMTVKVDSLIMRTINNMIIETVWDCFKSGDTKSATLQELNSVTDIKAVNLLKLYNDKFGESLSVENALSNSDFIKFAVFTINLYKDRLTKMSTLFNVGKKERFTPLADLRLLTLSEFASAVNSYLLADTKNVNYTLLPQSENVAYFQASGLNYNFADTSKIIAKSASGHDVTVTGVLACMYDRNAMGVCNTDRRVTTNYNAKAEFYTNYYKFDSSYFNDLNENFVVFFVA